MGQSGMGHEGTATVSTGVQIVLYDSDVEEVGKSCPFCAYSRVEYHTRKDDTRKHWRCLSCGMTWDGPAFER